MSSSNSFKVYLSSNEIENLQIIFLTTKLNLNITLGEKQINNVPCYPVVEVNNNNNNNNKLIFGSNNISRYFINNYDSLFEDLLDIEEFQIRTNNKTLLNQKIAWNETPLPFDVALPSIREALSELTSAIDTSAKLLDNLQKSNQQLYEIAKYALYPSYEATLRILNGRLSETTSTIISNLVSSLDSTTINQVKQQLNELYEKSPNLNTSLSSNIELPNIDIQANGMVTSLKSLFAIALRQGLPFLYELPASTWEGSEEGILEPIITRSNGSFGDFQCNNAMKYVKVVKSIPNYNGPKSPKDIATAIVNALPSNSIIAETSVAPNGFINMKVATSVLTETLSNIVSYGLRPPSGPKLKVLVDFSSPNIAKEMHVGHLRSTIIGDCVCRMLEFCGYDVLRINHVGDWGTQFGMLITYLQEAYPDIITNPPNISDLTIIYKASRARFDSDEEFKTRSRLNVVNLQAGDPNCRAIWNLLCEISRVEFQRVYDALQIQLEEVGESYYNPMIPSTLEELTSLGLTELEDKLLISRLPHFDIPLILRKSDGGYGYDSTDMAAIRYRLRDLDRDWLVYITDAGQAGHFHKVFDVARAAGWTANKNQRLDHIGFGVVCGEDGKRFKTKSGDTVKLMDLLNEARDRMVTSLQQRAAEGKTDLTPEQIASAADIIGYGAVKYFDLKQNCITNYIFNYDNMLDTRGDTAVYLLFAYARLASILRKGKEERGHDPTENSFEKLLEIVQVDHPAERQLAFELLQFGDVLRSAVKDLMPNRICDYLKEVSVKFTEFVTKCHVLNSDECHSRLILCEATRRVMDKCFSLLGIGTLQRI